MLTGAPDSVVMRGVKRESMLLLLWLCGLCLLPGGVRCATAGTAGAATLLLLLEDAPALRAWLAGSYRPHRDGTQLSARRRAIAAARTAAFAAAAPAVEDRIRGLLPAEIASHAGLECFPPLHACLVHVTGAERADALAALRAAQAAGQSGIAHVSAYASSTAHAVPGAVARAPRGEAHVVPGSARGAWPLVLGIIDNGADTTHPLFGGSLGTVHFLPGTPGEARDGRLLRSHGTAMLGIYAGLARGQGLVAGGVPQPGYRKLGPLPFSHTLIARAGPENESGQSDLVRVLAWLLAPAGAQPFPDLLNYSQGNGPLCAVETAESCVPTTWSGVTRLIDRAIDESALVVVKSAGNGGYGAATTMTVPGDTYNGITVGNMHAFDWAGCAPSAGRARHKIYRTSSVAPAAGAGPRLLDLVAPGVRIATAGVDPAYCRAQCKLAAQLPCAFCRRLGRPADGQGGFWKTNSGTSPAAAVVGAAAARLMTLGLRDPRLVKAVLINSAQAWTSAGQPHPITRGNGQGCARDGAAKDHGPYRAGSHYDRSYGWGYLDVDRALAEYPHARLDAIAPAAGICYRAELAAWDKLTLVWHRRVGTCADCGAAGWYRLSALDLALYDAADGHRLIDRDSARTAEDNVLQVSNGRGVAAAAVARPAIVRVSTVERQFDGTLAQLEPFALASRRPLARLAACPPGLR